MARSRVAVVVPAEFTLFEVGVAIEVLAHPRRELDREWYDVRVGAAGRGEAKVMGGLVCVTIPGSRPSTRRHDHRCPGRHHRSTGRTRGHRCDSSGLRPRRPAHLLDGGHAASAFLREQGRSEQDAHAIRLAVKWHVAPGVSRGRTGFPWHPRSSRELPAGPPPVAAMAIDGAHRRASRPPGTGRADARDPAGVALGQSDPQEPPTRLVQDTEGSFRANLIGLGCGRSGRRLHVDMRCRTGWASPAETSFLLSTAAISATFWVAGALVAGEWLVAGLPLSAAMFLAPALAVLITRSALPTVRLPENVRARPGRSWATYAAWSLLLPSLLAGCWGLAAWSGDHLPGLAITPGRVVLLCFVFTVSSACEELGWTRFLTRSLLSRMTVTRAGLGIGAIWAGLHIVPYLQAERPWAWVAWQCAFTIAFRVVIVAAVVLTQRWGIAVALHASYDVAWALYPAGGSHYDPGLVAPATAVVAVILVFCCSRAARAR